MATTWMKALHRGGTIASTLKTRTDYAKDPDKTDDGEYIDCFECDVRTVDSELLFSKRLYEQKTGRDQGKHDVVAYHIRMSFKPGEVTAEQALELGRELALRWTKGKHQYVVAAHTNTKNPHAHIIFNSVNLDCTHKFADFKGSAFALRRVSDRICLEYGLSIIEKPGLSKGYNRAEYLGESKPPTVRDRLRERIDASLPAGKGLGLEDFLAALKAAGVAVKHGKQLAFRLPDTKRFIRQDTLGEDYSLEAILERMSGKRFVEPKTITPVSVELMPVAAPNLLIDIQTKLQEGKGEGYRRWATTFNLKEMSRTLIYLQEHGITDYDDLAKKSAAVSSEYNDRVQRINAADARLKAITELQKHMGTYRKTREVYAQYRVSGWNDNFYETHRADITLCRAAKKYFDDMGYGKTKKLPSISSLKQEYAILVAEKKKLYSGWNALKERRKELLVVKSNADRILGVTSKTPERDSSRNRERSYTHER